eukprot:2086385-Amphidinium_carterae.1
MPTSCSSPSLRSNSGSNPKLSSQRSITPSLTSGRRPCKTSLQDPQKGYKPHLQPGTFRSFVGLFLRLKTASERLEAQSQTTVAAIEAIVTLLPSLQNLAHRSAAIETLEKQLQKIEMRLEAQSKDLEAAIDMRLEAAVEKLHKRHVQAINAPEEKRDREQTMIRMVKAMPPEALSRALSEGAVTVARAIDAFSFDERVVLKC